MSVIAQWTVEAGMRLHGLAPGPCTPDLARYTFSDGRTASVPLTLPLADPAVGGKAEVRLPAPRDDGHVERIALYAEDGQPLLGITFVPPLWTRGGDTVGFTLEAPV